MRRVAGSDAIFIYMETPTNHFHMAFVGVFDPSTIPPDSHPATGTGPDLYLRLRDLIAERLHMFPPFRQRLVEVPFHLHHPVFVDDPSFDLEFHLRRAALPAPGGQRELENFVGDIASRPLDRHHPLWEMYVVEGLEGGKWALVAKAHHVIVDGIGGNEVLVNLLDLTPEVQPVEPPEVPWEPETVPSDLRLLGGAVLANAVSPPRAVKAVAKTAGTLTNVLWNRQRKGDEQPLAVLGPSTILTKTNSPNRRVAFGRVDLDAVKQVKDAFGVKVNDVVLAMTGRALRRFLIELGDEPDSQLVGAVPISIRQGAGEGHGNRVAGMTVPLADDSEDPAEQLRRIHEVTGNAKERLGAITADLLTDWTEFTTPTLAAQAFRFYSGMNLGRRHRPVANITISNVPGPPFDLYVAGSCMEGMYPMGPVVHGQAINVTVVSYRDDMFLGAIADRSTVPDVRPFIEGMEKALGELQAAADAVTS
jgi:diacylglycerol O-acyltransferase / wax synthase